MSTEFQEVIMKTNSILFLSLLSVSFVSCSSDSGTVDESQVGKQDSGELEVGVLDAESSDGTTCRHLHFPQDYTYGDDCWGPPENLCKNGANTMFSWFCNADGSACCITGSSDCFYCGWVECKSYEAGVDISPECASLNIPQKYIDCANGYIDCLPEVEAEMRNSEECAFSFIANDPDYTYCWDSHLD